MKILILNGPSLNLLGKREPGIYGKESYDDLCRLLAAHAAQCGAEITFYQSNHEGDLIDALQKADETCGGVVFNPGAYTHYSYALYDAIRSVSVPVVEVHLTDVNDREPFRRVSVTAPACAAQICGKGFAGYVEAFDFLVQRG